MGPANEEVSEPMRATPMVDGLARADRDTVARAAVRRSAFLREEVSSGRVPAETDLGDAYLQEARHLETLFPLGPRTLRGRARRR